MTQPDDFDWEARYGAREAEVERRYRARVRIVRVMCALMVAVLLLAIWWAV